MFKRSITITLCLALVLSFLPFSAPMALTNGDINNMRVSAGDNYSMAIMSDNSLWGWGFDIGVHLGLRYTGNAAVVKPTKIMDSVKEVSAGWGTTLALKTDNTLWAWGDNMPGVGEDRVTYALKPEKVMDGVISAASGDWFVAAVKSDGTLWSWGDNQGLKMDPKLFIKDKTGPATVVRPVPKPIKLMDGAKKVAAYGSSLCVLKKDGTLLIRNGSVSGNKKVKIGAFEYWILSTGVKDVFTAAETVYFLKTDDSLWGVGHKVYEDLCKYDENKKSAYDRTPVKVMDGVKAAAVSDALPVIALKKDGKLVAWGMGGVIDSTFTKNKADFLTFMKYKSVVLMDNVSQISAWNSHYLVAKNDGTVWTWGICLPNDVKDGGNVTSTFGTKNFIKLGFSDAEGQLFTSGVLKSKLLSVWLKDKEASGEIPAYDPGYKANWLRRWDESVIMGMHFEKSGNNYYCYDIWDTFMFVATADGNRLKGQMSGMIFEIRMLPDGKSFAGVLYQNSAAEAEVWKGKIVK